MKSIMLCIASCLLFSLTNAQQQNHQPYTLQDAQRALDSLDQKLNKLAYRYDVLKKDNQQANYAAMEEQMRYLEGQKKFWKDVIISIEAAKNTSKGQSKPTSGQVYSISQKEFDTLPQAKKDMILQNPSLYKIE